MVINRVQVAIVVVALLAIGAESTGVAPVQEALVSNKVDVTPMYESKYQPEPSAQEQLDGMDSALDMLVQIQPSAETMAAMKAAMATDKAPVAKKVATVAMDQKTVSVEPEGMYSANVDPSGEEQIAAADSVFDMLVQRSADSDTSQLKQTLMQKEKEVAALKAKIAAKAAPKAPKAKAPVHPRHPRHRSRRERREDREDREEEAREEEMDHEDALGDKDSEVDELEESDEIDDEDPTMDLESEDVEPAPKVAPKYVNPMQGEMQEFSPAPRSTETERAPRVATPAPKPVVVSSGLNHDPEADAALEVEMAHRQRGISSLITASDRQQAAQGAAQGKSNAWLNFWASTKEKKKSGEDGETEPKTGNIVNPPIHELKPVEVRGEMIEEKSKKEAAKAEKEVLKLYSDEKTPQELAAESKAEQDHKLELRKIAAENDKGQVLQWAMGCAGNAGCEEGDDDAS